MMKMTEKIKKFNKMTPFLNSKRRNLTKNTSHKELKKRIPRSTPLRILPQKIKLLLIKHPREANLNNPIKSKLFLKKITPNQTLWTLKINPLSKKTPQVKPNKNLKKNPNQGPTQRNQSPKLDLLLRREVKVKKIMIQRHLFLKNLKLKATKAS